ncbi:hypothetical protein ACX40Y_07085 [Sphingomonas sp. RS6]
MKSVDTDYYRRREHQERRTANGSDDEMARRLHLELADRYSKLIDATAGGGQDRAADQR